MASLNDYKPLRLMGADADDLSVISACMQDSVMKLGDMAFLPDERRFALVANRFVWECAADRRVGPFARVRAGLHFDDVTACRFQHLRTDADDSVVDLLSVAFEESNDGAGVILLHFAGGAAVRLEVESVNAYLRDMSDPWRTRAMPRHDR